MHVLAPCVPQGETGNLDCVTNSAWVTWLQAMGAESYSVLAVERGGTNSSCSAKDLHCNVPDLLCGATYTFHITAVNSFCHSGPSRSFQIQTGANTLKQPNLHLKIQTRAFKLHPPTVHVCQSLISVISVCSSMRPHLHHCTHGLLQQQYNS